MAKEALRLRLGGCWVSKCLPFWAICLLYHSLWQWGWESQACRRGCAWRRALARFPLAGPSCLPLYPREPCLFICYYIGIGRSKAGGPSATTTLAPFLFLLFSLSVVHFFFVVFFCTPPNLSSPARIIQHLLHISLALSLQNSSVLLPLRVRLLQSPPLQMSGSDIIWLMGTVVFWLLQWCPILQGRQLDCIGGAFQVLMRIIMFVFVWVSW